MTAITVTPRGIAVVALQIALGYAAAGVHEEGGNNRGDQVEFFQRLMGGSPGDSWCDDFVSTCEAKAFARVNGMPEDRLHLLQTVGIASHVMPLSGYCPATWQLAIKKGMARGKAFTPSPGDYVLFLTSQSTTEPHHIGIVRQANADGTIDTVEGNTSATGSGSQDNGDGVYLKHHVREKIFGFVHFGEAA